MEIAYVSAAVNKLGEDVTATDLQVELDKVAITEVTDNGDGTLNVLFNDTQHNYNVDNGKVTKIEQIVYGDESWYAYEEVEGGIRITTLSDSVGALYDEICEENSDIYELTNSEDSEIANDAWEQLNTIFNEELNKKYPTIGNIPKTIDGNTVVEIGDDAFSEFDLTNVSIPSTVVSIGNGAFSCNQLTSVTIPDSVTSIGNDAFYSNQLKSINISNSVTSIGAFAFSDNQLTSINIPSSLTSIGYSAFYDCGLTSITIPSTVTSIGSYAFADNQLTNIDIPSSVTYIDRYAFANNQLVTARIPWVQIASYAFANNELENVTIYYNNYTGNDYLINSWLGVFDGNDKLVENTIKCDGTGYSSYGIDNSHMSFANLLYGISGGAPLTYWGLSSRDAFYYE